MDTSGKWSIVTVYWVLIKSFFYKTDVVTKRETCLFQEQHFSDLEGKKAVKMVIFLMCKPLSSFRTTTTYSYTHKNIYKHIAYTQI